MIQLTRSLLRRTWKKKLGEKQDHFDRCGDACREAELNLGQSAAELDSGKEVTELQKQSVLSQIKALHNTILKLEQQNLENGSIKDPLNRAMLRALYNQLDEQNRKADVVYDQFVLAFQSVMGWLRTLAAELKKPATKQFAPKKVRGILKTHYCKKGADITDDDELFTVVEEMIKTAMKPKKGRKGKKAPPSVAQFDDDELQACTRRIAHIFPYPEQYVHSTGGEEVDGEGEKDSAARAMSPLDRHIQAMIFKLEYTYLRSGKSSIGQKLDNLQASLTARQKQVRDHKKIDEDDRKPDWQEKLEEQTQMVETLQDDIRGAEGERAEALQDLSSTKLLLERLIISWTDTVEQAHQEQELTEFEARLEKFASIFENSVRPWVRYLQLIQTAAHSKPKSCLRFEMPKLTFRGESDQLALTQKNLHRIFNILDVPPEEREQRVRSAGTSTASSFHGDESD